jgi:hypothetical protein
MATKSTEGAKQAVLFCASWGCYLRVSDCSQPAASFASGAEVASRATSRGERWA